MATDYAILAGGCFWCTEAVFDQLRGVESVESGYIGGTVSGTQYRSALFPHSDAQHAEAVAAIARNQADWDDPIVTTIEPEGAWWRAEDYHQRYYENNGNKNGYCVAVVGPKLAKFRKGYAARLKTAA
jgi:peptide-methionine (S)-S-oxide reductase